MDISNKENIPVDSLHVPVETNGVLIHVGNGTVPVELDRSSDDEDERSMHLLIN